MESIREKERALFEAEFADSNKAVEALKGAIAHLEEAQSSALISNKAEVQSTLDLADAMAIQVSWISHFYWRFSIKLVRIALR